jgi:xylulokinase
MATYYIGIDVSTTATKALLVDGAGQVVASASTEYPFETPKPLWSEQDPALWWDGAVRSIRGVLANAGIPGEQVAGVGLTGQMHGLVLLDVQGKVLRPSILWNDQRTAAQCDEIHALVGKEHFIQVTGNVALTGFTAPKILWVRENEPEVYARACHVLLPKDYVRYCLTAEYAMDVADGSGTVLMDIKQRSWSPEILAALGIPAEWMPPLYEGPQITGRITAQAAEATGLVAGTPVIAGGGDQPAQAVGVGAVREGIVALTLGTSGVVFAPTGRPFIEAEGRLHAFCHAVPGKWNLMGVMLSAAGSLKWFHDTFTPGLTYDELVLPAGDVAPGAEGLLFLPYLTGERTPYPDPLARGGFVGLTVRHRLPHLTRAVLEGVAFGLRDSFELIRGAGLGTIEQVRASGGGTRSPVWRQILADVLGVELVMVNATEGAAYGAALLAGTGSGGWDSVEQACDASVRVISSTQPDPERVAYYNRVYPEYRALYPRLKPTFDAQAKL